MTSEIDTLLSEIRALSLRLSELADDHPDRDGIEARRSQLRSEARAIADTLRHPLSVRTEISMLEARIV